MTVGRVGVTASIDKRGAVTLRYRGRLHHIGVGPPADGWRVVILVAGLDIRVLALDGNQLCRLTLDPDRDYHAHAATPQAVSTMSRDIVSDVSRHHTAPPAGFEPATHGLGNRRSIP